MFWISFFFQQNMIIPLHFKKEEKDTTVIKKVNSVKIFTSRYMERICD